MTELAKALRYIPGHKSLIYFSSGVPYSVFTGMPGPETYPSRVRGVVTDNMLQKDASKDTSKDLNVPGSTTSGGLNYADKPERIESAHLLSRYMKLITQPDYYLINIERIIHLII